MDIAPADIINLIVEYKYWIAVAVPLVIAFVVFKIIT